MVLREQNVRLNLGLVGLWSKLTVTSLKEFVEGYRDINISGGTELIRQALDLILLCDHAAVRAHMPFPATSQAFKLSHPSIPKIKET
jgi:hypothetical protein